MRILRILPSAKSDLDLKVKEAGATPASDFKARLVQTTTFSCDGVLSPKT